MIAGWELLNGGGKTEDRLRDEITERAGN